MSQATTGTSVAIAAPSLQIFEGHVVNFHAKLTRHFHLKLTHPLA